MAIAERQELLSLSPAQKSSFSWVVSAPVQRVMTALCPGHSDVARFVGGCVRDSLLGLAPADVDIATVLSPETVVQLLEEAGIATVPTGIAHGTITAIADHRPFEITTLRADVSTDGRRATVAYTDDWAVDAGRRDFRINALYLNRDYQLYDPQNGLADIASGRVQFIGDAHERIREDYLRSLRFFRFSARFSKGEIDPTGLNAVADLKDGIKKLSAERIGDEFSKLLTLREPMSALSAMKASGILSEVWPAPPRLEVLGRLKAIAPEAGAPLSLAALWGADGEGVDARLRASNAVAKARRKSITGAASLDPIPDEKNARRLLYGLGVDHWEDASLLAEAEFLARSETPQSARAPEFEFLHRLPKRNPPPAFPFTGKHVIALGVEKGPRVAAILNAIEQQWIEEDFPSIDRAQEILKEQSSK